MLNPPLCIGLDLASKKFDACFKFNFSGFQKAQNSYSQNLNTYFETFENTSQGIIKLLGRLKSFTQKAEAELGQKLTNSDIPVILEATGSYHWLVSLMLKDAGFRVKVINPIITKKYQQASIRGSKTDKIDSQRLTEIGAIEGIQNLPDFADSRDTLEAKQYQSLLKKLTDIKQQLQANFDQILKNSHSLGLEVDLSSVHQTLEQIQEAINVLKKLITKNVNNFAQQLSQKTRGLSLFQATILSNAVGGKSFENRDQMAAFFGLDVKKRESGRWKGREYLSKRGNPFYRQILFQLGWSLSMNNPEYKKYYKRQKEHNQKHYYTAIIATARKFLRYFFKELKDYQKLLSSTEKLVKV
jgi:transposase